MSLSTTPPGASRADLAADQGIAVSPADAVRIETSVESARQALAKALTGSLFDTEPAHFDRFLVSDAKGAGR